ncbi:MAG: trypsin-like peptidase domain-containing protein [Clostridia bacterium]|nr:trypsin-like peptidase domain-containing protein [Clostridia bacterium]
MEEYNNFYFNDSDNHKNAAGEYQDGPSAECEPNERENYQWYDDEYQPAMSGTVTDERALSVYRPKPKKKLRKNPIFVGIVSSVLTSAICFGAFAFAFGMHNGRIQKPEGNHLTIGGNVANSTSGVTNTATNANITGQMAIPDIYDKVSPAVVSIITTSQGSSGYLGGGTQTGSGSGVILTADGYIVTNNHVVDGASIITVKTIANQSLDAQVVGKDARTDLAVLKVECEQALPFAELGDSSSLRVGDMALAIGNPLQEALASTLTVGYISAINRTMVIEDRQMTLLQTDAAINPGNSGGALINIFGQVIGINTAKSTGYDVEGLGFAIPINEAIPVVESIIEHGYVKGRPLVGITGIDVTEQIAKANNLPIGVYVQSVIEGGAADKGGLKPGDVILKFSGKEITSIDEINELRDECKVGDSVDVEVSRNGNVKKFTIVLQEETPIEEIPQNENQQQIPQQDGNQYGGGQPYQFPSDFFSWFGW